jgi:hypothetical protein
MFDTNRIEKAILAMSPHIAKLAPDAQATLSAQLNLSFDEHFAFQNAKSIAQCDGRLTLDEAMTIYTLLGGVESVFNKRPLATKVVLTKVMAELLKPA